VQQIQVTARFANIPSGNIAEFTRLAARAMELTRGEAGALQYDWFLDDDGSRCIVREAYQDSDAVLAHVAGLGEVVGQLLEVGGGCSFEVCGDPSPELVEATSGLQLTVLPTFLQGL
jgi:hypothetical protein